MEEKGKIRVLLSKIGLDFHEAGVKLIAEWLRDAGFEVIYLGLFQPPESIAVSAIQEDVDIIGVSSLCGAHLELAAELVEELKRRNAERIPVIIGGVIPPQDIPALKELGVRGVFLPGSSVGSIGDAIEKLVNQPH